MNSAYGGLRPRIDGPPGRPRVSDPATYRSGTPRIQPPVVARWHTPLHGLAKAIHNIYGLNKKSPSVMPLGDFRGVAGVRASVKSLICSHCYMRPHLDFCLTAFVVHLEYNTGVLVLRDPFYLELSFIGAENHEHCYHRGEQRCNHNPSFNHLDSHGAPPSEVSRASQR
jgi:hypothetical protein